MLSKFIKITILLFLFSAIVAFIVQSMAVRSSSYEAALQHLKSDKNIVSVFGDEAMFSLEPMQFYIRKSGEIGTAEFLIVVNGNSHERKYLVELERIGKWRVVNIQEVQ